MKTIDIIHDEHQALTSVLQAMRFVVGEIRMGKATPDFHLLSAMVDYITQVPEKIHHPKEDRYLFPTLRSRLPQAAALIDTLEAQHADGYRMTVDLLQALIHYQSVGAPAFAGFDAQLKNYLEFNWRHLGLEERELLPLARQALSDAEWAEIDREFAANFDPYSGTEGEFQALFRNIVNLTPAPYGLGPATAT